MTVVMSSAMLTVHLGDCLEILPGLPPASVHAVVTDAPYGLEFMGREWDAPWKHGFSQTGYRDSRRLPRPSSGTTRNPMCRSCHHHQRGTGRCACAEPDFDEVPADSSRLFQQWCSLWASACLRVLKPGGHLIVFGSPRTWHRLACGIEDAGFEIRDSIDWIHAQGFPKSLNVARAIDKAARGAAPAQATGAPAGAAPYQPRTDQARRWDGWGTGLKPAHEPILLARAPLAGTVAANVIAHQAGALHIDACRTGHRQPQPYTVNRRKPGAAINRDGTWNQSGPGAATVTGLLPAGRWPANIVFSHAPGCEEDNGCCPGCPVADLTGQTGIRRSGANPVRRPSDRSRDVYGPFTGNPSCRPARGTETGSADRYFPVFRYQPKATPAERPQLPGITHPTVKPLALMQWLIRLVTQPGGTVLDPFAGTGTTLHACLLEGMRVIGIEQNPAYIELCKKRLLEAGDLGRTEAPRDQPSLHPPGGLSIRYRAGGDTHPISGGGAP
jgi:DNA modification methylase